MEAPAVESASVDPAATLRLLLETVSKLSMVRHLEDIQRIVRSSARRLLCADGATFVLRDGEHCLYADEDAISPLWKGQRFPMDQCVSGWVMRHGRAAAITDIYADTRVPHEAYRPTFVKSLAMVPVRHVDPVAAIGVYWAQPHAASKDEMALAQALADSVAVALEHVRLLAELAMTVQISSTDPLTGVANRRAWDRALTAAVESDRQITIALVDLDHFKRINDAEGHQAGDELLRQCAIAWSAMLRNEDLLARYGGEEFGVLLPGISTELALTIAERLRTATPEKVTASIGIATRYGGEQVSELIRRADSALYDAKRAGRNRVLVAS